MGKVSTTLHSTYGSQKTPCAVFVQRHNGSTAYVVEGSKNINFCNLGIYGMMEFLESAEFGVEEITDHDCITSDYPITDLRQLNHELESLEE